MKTTRRTQNGGSAIGNIILILVVGYAGYVGLHYAPIFIESRTIDAILDNISRSNSSAPARSSHDVQDMIDTQLMINGMTKMQDKFQVRRMGGGYEILVSYDRPLDLLFEQRTLEFRKGLVLQ